MLHTQTTLADVPLLVLVIARVSVWSQAARGHHPIRLATVALVRGRSWLTMPRMTWRAKKKRREADVHTPLLTCSSVSAPFTGSALRAASVQVVRIGHPHTTSAKSQILNNRFTVCLDARFLAEVVKGG